jgi:hypothetical protein
MPTNAVNLLENDPRLENPTSMQISVTVRFADRSKSLARSILRIVRYRPGVSPYAARNDRTKWYREHPAAFARSSIPNGAA